MTRPRYSMPELARPWETLRTELKLEVLREDIAAIREALDAILASLGMDAPDRRWGITRGRQSRPSLWQLSATVEELQQDMKGLLRRMNAVERS